jgi:hypothetical protein
MGLSNSCWYFAKSYVLTNEGRWIVKNSLLWSNELHISYVMLLVTHP